MKLSLALILVTIVVIGCVEAKRVFPGKPKPPTTLPPVQPPVLPPPPTSCCCQVCGPGGHPCKNCPDRIELCKQLLCQLEDLDKKIRKCVCGQPEWTFA